MYAIDTETLLCVTVHNVKPLRSFKSNQTEYFFIPAQFFPIINAAVGKDAYFALLKGTQA